MSGRYKAYGEYRVVKLNGIEKLPSLWEIKQVRYLLKDGYEGIKIGPFGSALKLDDMVEEGVRVYGQENIINKDFSLCSRNISFNKYKDMVSYGVSVGDILITLMGTSGKCEIFPYEAKKGIIDSHLLRIRVNNKIIIPRFFKLLIDESPEIKHQMLIQGKGSIMHGLNSGVIKGLNLPLPTFLEQKLILNFLDHETAKIDTLIDKQQQLIELLEEKRQAVISHAVTKGLDPDVPMKDSGVEWLGEVPQTWEMWKLAHAFEVIGSGTTPSSDNDGWFEGDIPWVTTGELRETVITHTVKKVSKLTLERFSALKIHPVGSVVIAMYGATIGRLGILGVKSTTNQACCVLTFSRVIDNKYLYYWLGGYKDNIIRLSSGGGQPNINQEKVASLKISSPILKEQTQIAAFLDHETAKIDKLIDLQLLQIELLKERRTALISAAVTGKIDVRDWQVHVTQTESDEVMA
ncbi:restriction endonuclease subunit S [Rahnella contaminans]|uniref:restriction endonuclease subunit S n=1 Tax=Rahnella contaminans TaxID=2703882 RepID=UPI0023DA82F5|nr:restriction endonuclease subunit S [Rahnella contaminans]MDF1894262.1 restriction endonuclease subunit S [Rahnella contaminans]